jgi:protein-tyrosine phosphatase
MTVMRATLYWIEGPWPGRLAILPRPRGGDWLEDEVRAWREAGIGVVLSALTQEEVVELDIEHEAEFCRAQGIDFVSVPIPDRDVPPSIRTVADTVRLLESALAAGKNVAIHCRMGVGRSALLAACVMVAAGLTAEAAFTRIAVARGCPVPDTAEQRAWVARFATQVARAVPQA